MLLACKVSTKQRWSTSNSSQITQPKNKRNWIIIMGMTFRTRISNESQGLWKWVNLWVTLLLKWKEVMNFIRKTQTSCLWIGILIWWLPSKRVNLEDTPHPLTPHLHLRPQNNLDAREEAKPTKIATTNQSRICFFNKVDSIVCLQGLLLWMWRIGLTLGMIGTEVVVCKQTKLRATPPTTSKITSTPTSHSKIKAKPLMSVQSQ